jgi:outer membrane receptor for ferrienterochelin and colicins
MKLLAYILPFLIAHQSWGQKSIDSTSYNPLKEVIVTGVSKPITVQNALSTVKIINRKMIDAQGANTLNDVLRNQLNMQVQNDGLLGSSLSMQGFSSDKVKILLDGIAINGRENGSIDLSQIDLQNVARIEVIQGPMSVVYGTDAVGGIINIITNKNPRTQFTITNQFESIGKYNLHLHYNQIRKRYHWSATAGRNFFGGWNYIDTGAVQRQQLFKPKEQYTLSTFLEFKIKKSNLQFSSDYLKETLYNRGPLAAWNAFRVYAIDEKYLTTRFNNRIKWTGTWRQHFDWNWQLGMSYYHRIRNRYTLDFTDLNEQLTSGTGDQDTSIFVDYTSRAMLSNNQHAIAYTIGMDINTQNGNSLKLSNKTSSVQDYALFIQANKKFFKEKLKLQTGLRASYNTQYSIPLIPEISLLYNPCKTIQIRSSYSKGFRAPSLKERYLSFIDQNHFIVGNENLEAENSNHAQLSISHVAFQKNTTLLHILFTQYYNHVFNAINLALSNPGLSNTQYSYYNLKELKNTISSFEIDMRYKNCSAKLGASMEYSFKSMSSLNSFTALEQTLSLGYQLKQSEVQFNCFIKNTGARPFLQLGAVDGTLSYNGIQPAFTLVDLTADHSFSLSKKRKTNQLKTIVGIKNLLDVQSLIIPGVVAIGPHSGTNSLNFLGRSFFVTLTYQL